MKNLIYFLVSKFFRLYFSLFLCFGLGLLGGLGGPLGVVVGELVGDIVVLGVLGIDGGQESHDVLDAMFGSHGGDPVLVKGLHADLTLIRGDAGVVDGRDEVDLGGLEWVVLAVHADLEVSTGERGAGGSLEGDDPHVGLLVLQFNGDITALAVEVDDCL